MPKPIKVALLGPSGVGRIHAREFRHAGAEICAVLARTPESSEIAAEILQRESGRPVRACATLEEIAETDIDAASICTPPALHLSAAEAFLRRGRYVFCEKPLFWRDGLDAEEAGAICARLGQLARGRLLVNTNNIHLIRAYVAHFGWREEISSFGVQFFTHGPFRGDAIGVDLLAHALSMLLEVRRHGRLGGLAVEVDENRFFCKFDFDGIDCVFDLRQGKEINRTLSFRLNDIRVERIQRIIDDEFCVYLAPGGDESGAIAVTDPFRTSISEFVRGAEQSARFDTAYDKSSHTMELMAEIMHTAHARA